MIRTRAIFLSVLLVIAGLVSVKVDTKAQTLSVIDFEGILEGAIVDSVYSGYGISGEAISGMVHVYGHNPSPFVTTNAAMIFDATCMPGGTPADCSGLDGDLFQPEWGNILIISEDLDSTDPDDVDELGATFAFIYSDWGPGNVEVVSFDVQDVEEEEATEDARAYFYNCDVRDTVICPLDTAYFGTADIEGPGDSLPQTVNVGFTGVVSMLIDLEGSGAIDNVRITTEPTAVELKSFQVDPIDAERVKIVWETSAEIDNFGFNLYRSQERNSSQAEIINFEPAKGGVSGHRYEYIDTPPTGGRWFYWLSDIDTSGKETFHGIAFDTVTIGLDHRLFMPVLVTSVER